jgi:hypothetical protein
VKNAIVITTINTPTEAVEKFSALPSHDLVVVGDKKTPRDWRCGRTAFLGVDSPDVAGFSLAAALPFNHYCRKMLGYLHAMKAGAETIVDTDDDNIPKSGWSFPAFEGAFDSIPSDLGFINIYKRFSNRPIWPRGLPLRLIKDKGAFVDRIRVEDAKVGVWQGLADEDPDVDAIYRLTSDEPCNFERRAPTVLGRGTITPFNSQNTQFRRELFPLLYLPARVTFRFTDILRSFVAQPIMWKRGYTLGFVEATVVQKRNPHDYFKDFVSEIPMYEHTEKSVEVVAGSLTDGGTIADDLRAAYAALHRAGIVPSEELPILDCWLKDLAALGA